MDTELRKRFEEAAEKSYKDRYPNGIDLYKDAQIDGFIAGAELGYNEAIAQAKEWLKENSNKYASYMGISHKLIIDFEADMNKLLEEKK